MNKFKVGDEVIIDCRTYSTYARYNGSYGIVEAVGTATYSVYLPDKVVPRGYAFLEDELILFTVEAEKPASEGGTKHDSAKPDLSLLPFKALEDVARVMEFGAAKYGRNNWQKGFDEQRLVAAALRHIGAYNEGEELDPESGQSHMAHAACNMLFLLWLKKNGVKK